MKFLLFIIGLLFLVLIELADYSEAANENEIKQKYDQFKSKFDKKNDNKQVEDERYKIN